MDQLAKKLPTVVAILALAYVGVEAMQAGVDKALIGVVVLGIAGLGGFYMRDLLERRLPR